MAMLEGPISRPVELSLRFIGAWPNSSHRILQRFICIAAILWSLTFQYWYLFAHLASVDLPDLLDCLSLTLSNSLLLFKFMMIWLNARLFYDILAVMAEDWCKQSSTVWTTQSVTSKAAFADRFSKSIVGMYSVSCILYIVSGFLQSSPNPSTNGFNDTSKSERTFFLKMEFPFDITSSPVFELVTIVQLFITLFAAYMAGMMLALIITLVLHIASQIDIICGKLLEIRGEFNAKELNVSKLRDIIVRHQRVISLADDIDTVFSYMSLIQFMSNTIVICFLGFVLVTSLGTPNGSTILVKCAPYYVVINFEAFILCSTGEYLTLQSERISQTAYGAYWYELSPRERLIPFLLILRSQRVLTLSLGKFMHLSLESFADILKMSASYISVLHAMYHT